MKGQKSTYTKFDTRKSIRRATSRTSTDAGWTIDVPDMEIKWTNRMERVELIRKGLPYESIEVLSALINMSIKQVLTVLEVPQTTYNKKKKEKSLLSGRDSELILLLVELLDYGHEVFNQEQEKFQRWLKKPNLSLGGVTPESLFDSVTGIQEVKNSLNRIEFGSMA